MNPAHLNLLRCPKSSEELTLGANAVLSNGRIETGELVAAKSGNRYPIVNFIPRFVPIENYASSFGLQWNVHNRTQYDDTSTFKTSAERFTKETKWKADLRGEYMLEIGSGSGRFTKEAVKTGAMVVTFDYSHAVEANYKSNGQADNVLIVQASIYEMPFQKGFFDKAFCFGVLQHTPDPEASFLQIPTFLKPGGSMATDIYVKDLTHWVLQPKYWIRRLTRGGNPERLYRRIKKYVDFMWPVARIIRKIPRIGPALNWKLIIADYSRELPNASDATLKEWAYLDTMDMLSPMYDKPQTLRTFSSWHEKAGLKNIDVHYGYNGIEGRGTRA
jgi:SAM-dependent methyltransferase